MSTSSTIDFVNEINTFVNIVTSQFISRTKIEGHGSSSFHNITLTPSFCDQTLWFTLKISNDEAHNITIPIPFVQDGIVFIKTNGIRRAVCNHYDVKADRIISYISAIQTIFMGDFSQLINTVSSKKSMFIQQLAYSVINKNSSIIVYQLQKAINELVNKMPLHETNMNSWMMNNRLMLIDPIFDGLSDPKERLNYQIAKNCKYFDRGWTSVGLSDGTLADKNYIITHDMRCYTPFGPYHHNPQRNLYSTLGMKGDELPNIRSRSMQNLMDIGITRTGWNWNTAFVDVKETFEDQIVLDNSLKKLFTTKERRIQCFGKVLVHPGQKIKYGQALSICPDGRQEIFEVFAEEAWVQSITKTVASIGGIRKEVSDIIIIIKRYFKDAVKITNMHGNKGVVTFRDLGYAKNEKTGERVKLHVLVSAKTVDKRKNYGQILEMLFNNIRHFNHTVKETIVPLTISKWCKDGVAAFSKIGVKTSKPAPIIIEDDMVVSKENLAEIEALHRKMGFGPECVLTCDTYAGKFEAVCGEVFWGVVKDPEDQLWDNKATITTNGKGLRTAGLKFSIVEFKALTTIFGKNNPVIDEVLSHIQGVDLVQDAVEILKSKTGEKPAANKTILNPLTIKTIDQSGGTLFSEEELSGTLADEFFYRDGCVIKLPIKFQTAIPVKDFEAVYEGMAVFTEDTIDKDVYKALYTTNHIVIPGGNLRRAWKHPSGLFGMSELSTILNNIVLFCKRHAAEPEEPRHINMLYKAIKVYYTNVANLLSTKNGIISTQALSVRYPYSAKAVATLSTTLPMNTVEIHHSMAEIIGVKEGDCVIIERFPCLGFMGVRVQKVTITDDPMCKFTIRASNQSLVSTNLDFDGDVIYIAAFHTKEAKAALLEQWENPSDSYWKYIDELSNRKGGPFLHTMCLKDYNINVFPKFTAESQSKVVGKLTGVKAQTGPVIAMTYNIMRIMENSGIEISQDMRAGIEYFVEKAGQSVFEQKHGGQSLHDIVIDAICTADAKALITEGFEEHVSKFICDIVKNKAAKMHIHDLKSFHEKGLSNIVNKIVRAENKLYFASRTYLEGCRLLDHINQPVVDLPSRIFKMTTSGEFNNRKNILDMAFEDALLSRITEPMHNVCKDMFLCIDRLFGVKLNLATIEKFKTAETAPIKNCAVIAA